MDPTFYCVRLDRHLFVCIGVWDVAALFVCLILGRDDAMSVICSIQYLFCHLSIDRQFCKVDVGLLHNLTYSYSVLLHFGGFCNNCTPKRCLHNALCTCRCISKQLQYKTPFSHNDKNYITFICLEKNNLFGNIILTQSHAWHITKVVELTI